MNILHEEEKQLFRDRAVMAEQEIAALQLAPLDEQTAISNRRDFITLAQQALSNCTRRGQPSTLVLFDLDDFTSINDTFCVTH